MHSGKDLYDPYAGRQEIPRDVEQLTKDENKEKIENPKEQKIKEKKGARK